MKYLTRSKVYEKVEPKKDAKKIYIFCEDEETEIRYFKYFQGFSSNIDIIPIPNINGQSDPIKLKENAEFLFFGNNLTLAKFKLSSEYKDEVWFAIDTDRWNEGNKILELREYCASKNTNLNPWTVVQSNPCFELWFYYHVYDIKPNANEVANSKGFKNFVNTKIKGGFDSRKMPIELETAIQNSIKNFEVEQNQPKLYSTEAHLLGTKILPFVKTQLDKLKKMMLKQNISKK